LLLQPEHQTHHIIAMATTTPAAVADEKHTEEAFERAVKRANIEWFAVSKVLETGHFTRRELRSALCRLACAFGDVAMCRGLLKDQPDGAKNKLVSRIVQCFKHDGAFGTSFKAKYDAAPRGYSPGFTAREVAIPLDLRRFRQTLGYMVADAIDEWASPSDAKPFAADAGANVKSPALLDVLNAEFKKSVAFQRGYDDD